MLVQSADIIYFPSESIALDSRSEAAWKLLDALRHNSPSFALGWDLVANEGDHRDFLAEAGKAEVEGMSPDELEKLVITLEEEMYLAAEELRFEYAAKLRDEIKELRRELMAFAQTT